MTTVTGEAIIPEPDEPQAQKYRVPDSLNHRIHDPAGGTHWPGDEFQAVFPPEQEARLIRRGQIERVETPANDQSEEG